MISGIGMKSVSTNEDTEKVLTDQSEALKMTIRSYLSEIP